MKHTPLVTLRPWSPPSYTCRVCGYETRFCDDPDAPSGQIICRGCAGNWGTALSGLRGTSRRDRAALRRVSAFAAAIEWEVKNGSR